jgi:hypothetical protein
MKATFDPAKNLDLYFRKSRNGSKEFRFFDTGGDAFDLTGNEFEFRSDFTVSLVVVDNVITFEIEDDVSPTRDSYFWQLFNVTTGQTWLCGTAYFTDGLSADASDSDAITINLTGELVQVTINLSGGSDFIGEWDPTGDLYPTNSLAGNEWVLTDQLVKDGFVYAAGTIIKAKINDPGQTRTNWIYLQTL